MTINDVFSSYKDPSGYVFTYKNRIYRRINYSYKENYEFFIQSGLYKKLTDIDVLIKHKERSRKNFPAFQSDTYKIIEPVPIPLISYPYEWCFSQLKDAALVTLHIQKIALDHGMSLKDASSFNIQFLSGKPIFIDTLSFEKYEEGKPWIAYKQFCEQFLIPLALSSYTDLRLNRLLQLFPQGIPLDLAAKLLPFTSKLNLPLLLHIFLHAKSYKQLTGNSGLRKNIKSFKKNSLIGLIDNLEDGVKSLRSKEEKTTWTGYYENNDCLNYSDKSFKGKKTIVLKYLKILQPKTVWDLGANTGIFSRIAGELNIFTVSLDNDPNVVEQNYLKMKQNKEKNILPLCIDLLNPTPAIGWENKERDSLLSRPLPDMIMALALIHHLVIGNNIPFSKLAQFFSRCCKSLIIEFVPKEDQKVRLLLLNRTDIFTDYIPEGFEKEFSKFFPIKYKTKIPGSQRIIYLFINKNKL